MTIREEKRDLLSLPQGWAIAHCISADCSMVAGVAKQILNAYGKNIQITIRGAIEDNRWLSGSSVGCVYRYLNVFNMITKKSVMNTPKLEDIEEAILSLSFHIREGNIPKLAMPRICCGLDKQKWEDIKPLIEKHFQDIDVEILICYI